MKLTLRQTRLLKEARRRFALKMNQGYSLADAWTGLGSYSTYKPVLDAGLMTYAIQPNPRYLTWWKLTPDGCVIVQAWIDNDTPTTNGPEYGLYPER